MESSLMQSETSHKKLYKYLLVMGEDQIHKLRKIATGTLPLKSFSEEEIHVLETKLLLRTAGNPPVKKP